MFVPNRRIFSRIISPADQNNVVCKLFNRQCSFTLFKLINDRDYPARYTVTSATIKHIEKMNDKQPINNLPGKLEWFFVSTGCQTFLTLIWIPVNNSRLYPHTF